MSGPSMGRFLQQSLSRRERPQSRMPRPWQSSPFPLPWQGEAQPVSMSLCTGCPLPVGPRSPHILIPIYVNINKTPSTGSTRVGAHTHSHSPIPTHSSPLPVHVPGS